MKNKGFALVELSIVIVVIGLLTGGIFASNSLINSARLREVIGEYDRYVQAIKEFEDKYQALPGDMNNAETIWGSDANCPSTPYNTVPKIATCNGDGNGHIGNSTAAGNFTLETEWFRAWQQLSNAGLIEGKFTGAAGKSSGGDDADVGVNVPQSKLKVKSGWTLMYYIRTIANEDADNWGGIDGHVFYFGSEFDTVGGIDNGTYTKGIALTPAEALTIDQKIDDGKPGQGFIKASRTGTSPLCTLNDTSQAAATYNAAYSGSSTDGGIACQLTFILGF